MRTPLLAGALVYACAAAATEPRPQATDPLPADRRAQVDAIFAPWSSKSGPGCAVGISSNGVVDHARGYGMSSLEHGIPITPHTVFHAASVSKRSTASAVGLLDQEVKLSLQDDVRKHVPELPDHGRRITIAQLIHHTNGLRDHGHILACSGWRSGDVADGSSTADRGCRLSGGATWGSASRR